MAARKALIIGSYNTLSRDISEGYLVWQRLSVLNLGKRNVGERNDNLEKRERIYFKKYILSKAEADFLGQ